MKWLRSQKHLSVQENVLFQYIFNTQLNINIAFWINKKSSWLSFAVCNTFLSWFIHSKNRFMHNKRTIKLFHLIMIWKPWCCRISGNCTRFPFRISCICIVLLNFWLQFVQIIYERHSLFRRQACPRLRQVTQRKRGCDWSCRESLHSFNHFWIFLSVYTSLTHFLSPPSNFLPPCLLKGNLCICVWICHIILMKTHFCLFWKMFVYEWHQLWLLSYS